MPADKGEGLAGVIAGVGQGGSVSLYAGTCAYSEGKWRVYRGGKEVQAVWVESASPRTGSCLLAVDSPGPVGQSMTYVLGMTFATAYRQFDTAQITNVGGNGICSVVFPDGSTNTRARVLGHYNPVVGNVVFVIWRGGEPYLVGQLSYGHVANPPGNAAPLPELPRVAAYGSSQYPSSMHKVWDSEDNMWSVSKGRDLRLSPTQSAVFAYDGSTKALSEQVTVTAATLSLGRRLQNLSNPGEVKLQVYRSDAEQITSSQPTLLEGPYTITVPPNYDGSPLELPVELAVAMRQGGSITVRSTSTVAFADSPQSGYLKFTWRNNS